MLIRTYLLRFVTPAFLGNAEQTGQWRTPPIKALLRQWWRVAYAADQPGPLNSASVGAMRKAEGSLFGVAADKESDSRKSQVRIRLGRWDKGRATPWNGADGERVEHREVKNREGRLAPVGPMLYLGYGPLVFAQGQTSFKVGAPIQADEVAALSLAFPAGAEACRFSNARLKNWPQTVSGNSCWAQRSSTPSNGWASAPKPPWAMAPCTKTPPSRPGAKAKLRRRRPSAMPMLRSFSGKRTWPRCHPPPAPCKRFWMGAQTRTSPSCPR